MQFGSPLSLLPGWKSNWASNLGEWAVAIVGKGGGTFGAGIYTGTEQVATLNGTTSVASTLELGTHGYLSGTEFPLMPAKQVVNFIGKGLLSIQR